MRRPEDEEILFFALTGFGAFILALTIVTVLR